MTSSHGISETSPVHPWRWPVSRTTAITTESTTPATASTVSSHCQTVTSRHEAGGPDLTTAACTAPASACGTMPALQRAASRRLPAHGSGRPLPTESANAVIALSTSDCCAWPAVVPAGAVARSARIGSRRPPSSLPAGQPVSRAACASRALAIAWATADSPAARANASVSLPPAPSGRWRRGRRRLPTWRRPG